MANCFAFTFFSYEGQYESNAPNFFLRNYNHNYNEIYIYHVYILYKPG
jgi:hypothetical protein